MKKSILGTAMAAALLAFGTAHAQGFDPHGDIDRDGIANRYDRDIDGDGVRNRRDQFPYNPRRS
jgi:hypothetical protein